MGGFMIDFILGGCALSICVSLSLYLVVLTLKGTWDLLMGDDKDGGE